MDGGRLTTVPACIRWPYLRNLPEKYAYMPIFYNNSEFGSIQIPSLMKTVQVGTTTERETAPVKGGGGSRVACVWCVSCLWLSIEPLPHAGEHLGRVPAAAQGHP